MKKQKRRTPAIIGARIVDAVEVRLPPEHLGDRVRWHLLEIVLDDGRHLTFETVDRDDDYATEMLISGAGGA